MSADLPAHRRRPWPAASDAAASDIVGTAILVGIAVVLAAGFSALVLDVPAPIDAPRAELALELDKGAGGWGTGDEELRVTHEGGETLDASETTILVSIDGAGSSFSGDGLASAFSDGRLAIGERWTRDMTISGASSVILSVVSDLGDGTRLLATATFEASDCSGDTTAPVASFAQSPANVTASASGAVTVTVTLDDDCSGVDTTQTPHLFYRVNDGSAPAYTDGGAMTFVGSDQWQDTIPDPTWASVEGDTLEYYVQPMTDLNANTAASATQSDLVDAAAPCASDTTAPTALLSQSPNDLTMNATGAVTATIVASDGCAGVDDAHAPTLMWRVNDGTNPAYASAGAMTLTATSTWEGTIPAQDWLAARGDTLQWYASDLRDLNANAGDTSVSSDLVDNPCAGDATAPTAALSQSPPNVAASTVGGVTIGATLSDACAGVDGSATPHLFYRLNDGSDPAYTDAGAMTSTGTDQWEKTIADPTWTLQAGKTLQYYVSPLVDRFGNSGASATQSDLVDVVDPCAGDVAAPTGSFAQTPSDLTMNSTGSVAITLTASDGCAGVDDATTPRLYYRVNDGSNPSYTDNGLMTLTGTHEWQATIPSQDWLAARGDTLEYYAGLLEDVNGNTGNTATQSDVVDNPCGGDTTGPTASFSRSPSNVTTQTTGTVNVTVTLSDACAGVDTSVVPHLFYRVNGTSPPFTDGGAMSSAGANQWYLLVPDPTWASQGNKTLEYYASPLTDRFGNTRASTLQQELIDVVVTHTYVATNTPTTGSVASFASAQAEDDVEATISEGGTSSTLTTSTYSANAVVSNGWSTAVTVAQVSASDNVYATDTSAANKLLELNHTDPSGIGTIVSVTLYAEVSILGYTNDAFTLAPCLGLTCSATSGSMGGSATDVLISYNVTTLRPGGGSWSAADLANLVTRVSTIKTGPTDGTWRLDHAYVEVKHVPATYAMSVQLDWTGVPSGVQRDLELDYRVSGDTFVVEVWDGSTWNTRGSALTSATSTTWSYTLTTAEYLSGSPRIRFVDATPSGTTQGQLFLDYARVKTT